MTDRKQLLKQIQEISFTVNDLNLYLDTHPTDQDALTAFSQAMNQRKQLMETFGSQYEPLTIDCVNLDGKDHFTWTDGPAPWEGGTL